jgi:endothelial cell adhesion protein
LSEQGTDNCPLSDTKAFSGSKAAVVAGAVVGTFVGLVLIAGLVLLYQRRSKTLEELANDIK